MRTLIAIIRKEFLQIFRNKVMLRIIIMMPIIQLVILVNAANFEMKNISMAVIDKDNSTISSKLISAIRSSGYFVITDITTSNDRAFDQLVSDKADVIIEIPSNFEQNIYRNQIPQLSVTVNAINGMKAGIASGYIYGIVSTFGRELYSDVGIPVSIPLIETTYSQWFNPLLDYKSLMLPGVLAILITLIGVLLSSLNIVREKEIGTIEQLNVTPINKTQFIIGKLFPFWVIGLFQLSVGLLVCVLLFKLHIEGSLLLLYGVVAIYMIAVLGLGFLISTISQTQIQAMFVTLFFSMTFILLSGLFTPTDSMPEWAKKLNIINPIAYMVEIIRLVILKGSNFTDIIRHVTAIVIFGVVTNCAVIWRYRKTS